MRLFISLLLLFSCAASWAQTAGCSATATTACLQQGRFEVALTFDSAGAAFVPPSAGLPSGAAQFIAAATATDAAVFEFYDTDQYDAFVKVLDGCPINGHFWVFAAGATDAATEISVTDTATGDSVIYASAAGQPFQPVTDTTAFQTCDAPATTQDDGERSSTAEQADRGPPPCGSIFCLQGGRFGLDVAFETAGGITGSATPVGSRDHTGLGALFDSARLDLISSVLDGRTDNGAYWFLASAPTNEALTYTLTDVQTGRTNVYVNPFGPASTIADRGQPVEASLRGVQAGDAVGFELVLSNTAPTERTFRATVPVPPGAANLRFTCLAAGDAVCPNVSGNGALDESGPIAAHGGLTYSILFDRASARGANGFIEAEATVETAAHALADTQTRVIAAGEAASALSIPANAPWMLLFLAGLLAACAAAAFRRNRAGKFGL